MNDQAKIDELLAKLKAKDSEDYDHSLRVQKWADSISTQLNLPATEKQMVSTAALLHDIGILDISEDISKKTSRLSFDEYEEIKLHAQKAENYIKELTCFKDIYPIILHHHENVNGFGYPDGLEGDEIPLGSKIIHVAEAYDTMTSSRKNRKSVFSKERAISDIKEYTGRIYDAKIVEAFLTVVASE